MQFALFKTKATLLELATNSHIATKQHGTHAVGSLSLEEITVLVGSSRDPLSNPEQRYSPLLIPLGILEAWIVM